MDGVAQLTVGDPLVVGEAGERFGPEDAHPTRESLATTLNVIALSAITFDVASRLDQEMREGQMRFMTGRADRGHEIAGPGRRLSAREPDAHVRPSRQPQCPQPPRCHRPPPARLEHRTEGRGTALGGGVVMVMASLARLAVNLEALGAQRVLFMLCSVGDHIPRTLNIPHNLIFSVPTALDVVSDPLSHGS
jgi:hypothetical protein